MKRILLSMLLAWSLFGLDVADAATIRGSWAAEIEMIAMDPSFPTHAAPDLAVGDRITYEYEVVSDDREPLPGNGEYQISPPIEILTEVGVVSPGSDTVRISAPSAIDPVYQIGIGQIASIDPGSMHPPGLTLFHGFVDFLLFDGDPLATDSDALPMGAMDLSRFEQPGDANHFFVEFTFQSPDAPFETMSWYAAGRVLSVVHEVPEAASGWLVVAVLSVGAGLRTRTRA